MSQLRILSYLPNPRLWKATIAARLNGVALEVRGAAPDELADWLWDFDAHPLAAEERAAAGRWARTGRVGFAGAPLFKTDAFLAAQPFGTVAAAFGLDGTVGIFESNSILRAVGRLGQDRVPLYGGDAYEASRIDSFLDASLVLARESQIYLLALRGGAIEAGVHGAAREAFAAYMAGIEQALRPDRRVLVGDGVTLADICFACEVVLFSAERRYGALLAQAGLAPVVASVAPDCPRALAHLDRLTEHPAFAPDVKPYRDALARLAA